MTREAAVVAGVVLSPATRDYSPLAEISAQEATASRIEAVGPFVIPTLLQTDTYAESAIWHANDLAMVVHAEAAMPEDERARLLKARIAQGARVSERQTVGDCEVVAYIGTTALGENLHRMLPNAGDRLVQLNALLDYGIDGAQIHVYETAVVFLPPMQQQWLPGHDTPVRWVETGLGSTAYQLDHADMFADPMRLLLEAGRWPGSRYIWSREVSTRYIEQLAASTRTELSSRSA